MTTFAPNRAVFATESPDARIKAPEFNAVVSCVFSNENEPFVDIVEEVFVKVTFPAEKILPLIRKSRFIPTPPFITTAPLLGAVV